MKKTVILLILVIGIFSAGYLISVNNPLRTDIIANGNISKKATAYIPSSVSIQHNESRAQDYCFDLFLSVGSTFFIDQGVSEVLEIEDDYMKIYGDIVQSRSIASILKYPEKKKIKESAKNTLLLKKHLFSKPYRVLRKTPRSFNQLQCSYIIFSRANILAAKNG